ncbi:MAG: sulfite exporter TauE/SafE family protein, partial [Burkholderiaceae bacterium]|nr:sulfite exporter TauE/SafE family protein [Burkholderiaceae bacterium]
FIGMVIGITLLLKAPPEPLLITLGAFAAFNGIRVLTKKKSAPIQTISQYWSIPFGVAGGIFTALFATGGPIYASYLAMRFNEPNTLRATMAFAILIFVFLRLVFMLVTGLILNWEVLGLALFLVPCMVIGLWIGSKTHRLLSIHHMQLAYGSILLFAGSVLLIKQLV